MPSKQQVIAVICLTTILLAWAVSPAPASEKTNQLLKKVGVTNGICAVLGDHNLQLAKELARSSELTLYLQLPRPQNVQTARKEADKAGLLGTRIYIDQGPLERIHLADNLADALIAVGQEANEVPQKEVLRVLRPQAKALLGNKEIIKPVPPGLDDWSHPYHGPDNNPLSKDQRARAPYLTQFLAEPQYGPSPQVAVAAAGKVFKVFGNVAWHKREEPFLNKLVCFNGYNGTIIWTKNLPPGVQVHRNTIIATPQILYLGDDKSCKLIDTVNGQIIDEISPPADIAGGTFWKWMALQDGVLYALIGEQEYIDEVKKWNRKHHGWPWTGISKGYNQKHHTWGFGQNLLAIDPKTKKVLWHQNENAPADARAICMNKDRIFIFRFGTYLVCRDTKSGKELWRKNKNNDLQFFETMGKYHNRQSWQTNWRSTNYLKCSDKALYFAGPQMRCLMAVSVQDGSIIWFDKYSNFQLIISDDALYGISGPWGVNRSKKFNPLTGEVLANYNIGRRACTRVTASTDAIFYRAMGGSVRFDLASDQAQWISPMRPQCHDGVNIANGMLYWWPWACDCQLTLTGVIALTAAGDFNFTPQASETERLESFPADRNNIATLSQNSNDWPTFRANNKCNVTTKVAIADTGNLLWETKTKRKNAPTVTPPVTAGGLIFVADDRGAVKALDAKTGNTRWSTYTGGAVRFPPTIWQGRALVGSGDGSVYAFETANGRTLWRFRAAPQERKIPVYGTLLSTWPAASGVVVHDGTAYVAAGIVNYDGTYVYALDPANGKIKWQNNSSGHLDPQARTGVSVQGHMIVNDGKLYLAGGTSVSPAVYDLTDGKCLNDPGQLKLCTSVCPRGWELFLVGDKVVACGRNLYANPKYVVYDRTVASKMLHAANGSCDITWENNNQIKCFKPIDKQVLNQCVTPAKKAGGHVVPPWGKLKVADQPLWEYKAPGSMAVAVCKNAVLVAKKTELVALNLTDGQPMWTKPLPDPPVPWGLAVDADGRIIVSLTNGRLICFQ
ncbi:MAG: outer membrane protein assembly factor BamB family protein [Planctomycetota bacterium]|jgi:outer membrane protein assembly factor BamB